MADKLPKPIRKKLRSGTMIPAHPLALTAERKLDERRQRALTRYYIDAGVGGVAVGVHTTQFAIRHRNIGLLRPVLELAAETVDATPHPATAPLIKVAGICGPTRQAVPEAVLAKELGYDLGLLSLSAFPEAPTAALIEHVRAVAEVIPIFGFYLQPAAGGRLLSYEFWREFCEIEDVAAIKMAPFNRYQTLDVVRAVAESSRRKEIALYTGNDDHILQDLTTRFRFKVESKTRRLRIVGGLLGHWSVWARRSLEHFNEARRVASNELPVGVTFEELANEVTDANGALFDVRNNFSGCIAGLHEILRRQGLLEGIWLLDPNEGLSSGQADEIDRVYRMYPHLHDDPFVAQNLDYWMR